MFTMTIQSEQIDNQVETEAEISLLAHYSIKRPKSDHSMQENETSSVTFVKMSQNSLNRMANHDDEIPLSRKYKLVISFLVYLGALSYVSPSKTIVGSIILNLIKNQGLVTAINGPTLTDVTEILQSELQTVSQGFIYRNVSYCLGALSCGWLFTLISREIGLSLSLLVLALSNICVPYLSSVSQYFLSQSLAGVAVCRD